MPKDSNPSALLLTNQVFVLAGRSPKTFSSAISLHLFPVPQVLQRWAWNHSQRQWVSFWVEKVYFHGLVDKASYHTDHWDPDCLAKQDHVCDLYPMCEPEHGEPHPRTIATFCSHGVWRGSFPPTSNCETYTRGVSWFSISLASNPNQNWRILPLPINTLENALLL